MKRKASDSPRAITIAEGSEAAITLDDLLERTRAVRASAERHSRRLDGIFIGRLVDLSGSGQAVVALDGEDDGRAFVCPSLAELDTDLIGRDVALMFEAGDPGRPLVLGVVQGAGGRTAESARDGETLVFTARKEIVLRCGQASLTLTRSGKVLIRGAYVSSRASGVNRVNGASVQIN